MPTVIVGFLLVVGLTAAVSLAVLYWQYRTWPAVAWKGRLTRHVSDLHRRRRELSGPDPDDPRAGADRLADDLFGRHLRSIAVDRLAEYPGIGPGTVERVRATAGGTVDDLIHFRFELIHGIGPGKANDLRAAVAGVVREARSRFDAGGCPEAEEYRSKLARLTAEAEARASARQRELAAVEVVLRSAEPAIAAAQEITFWNYLLRRGTAGPSEEMMGRPLPTPTVPPPPLPVAQPAARALPPPVRGARPAVARPAPQPAAFPPAATPAVPPPAADLFQAELHAGPKPASAAGGHPWLPRLVAVARFGFVIARADGRVAQAEKKVIRSYLDECFGHDPVLARDIDPVMERTEARVPTEAEAIAAVVSVTAADERCELYRLAERIADASGPRNQREREMLARVAAELGVTPKGPGSAAAGVAAGVRSPEPTGSEDPRTLLEIDHGTAVTRDLVRRRYALLTDKLDPAKAAALGPEFARMAEEKRTRLRAAAEALLAGEPLEKPAPPPADLRHNPDLDDVFGA